jgi:hypothetical protein
MWTVTLFPGTCVAKPRPILRSGNKVSPVRQLPSVEPISSAKHMKDSSVRTNGIESFARSHVHDFVQRLGRIDVVVARFRRSKLVMDVKRA